MGLVKSGLVAGLASMLLTAVAATQPAYASYNYTTTINVFNCTPYKFNLANTSYSGAMVKAPPKQIWWPGDCTDSWYVGTWTTATGGLITSSDVYYDMVDNDGTHRGRIGFAATTGWGLPNYVHGNCMESSPVLQCRWNTYLSGGAGVVNFYVSY
ncbi:hypothetical protein OG331_49735 [Streptomyces sp. NBC_01017]|uniref:Uncharacterized protein n=1 Tax=Streptomyces sp. NBC_00180 TaxID=2903632 RepID=A0AAU1IBI0_9ACTN|nr:hypothetical protein OG331_02240 [Streptomyces sp. NBC_01017]WSV35060.1 hypothetical protein OG331_49735 [Streptomyces sp. NBC_01017]